MLQAEHMSIGKAYGPVCSAVEMHNIVHTVQAFDDLENAQITLLS